ncbi:hypothetical protein Aperf_G00000041405 [Anoplocephala perfoliata]
MPLQPWQPKFQSTPTASTSHLPPAPSSRSDASHATEERDDEDKENGSKLSQEGTKTSVPPTTTTKRRTSKTPNMLSRRNERERNRVHQLNQGFDRLRAVVPKREGEYLSKISTLKRAIRYIEHLDRVLHEEPVPVAVQAEEAAAAAADSGVVGTDLGAGNIGMEMSSSGHQDADEEQEKESEGERLSPIFPPRMDESKLGKPLPFLSSRSDSGFLSGSFYAPKLVEQYSTPPPVRLYTLDFEAPPTPNR